MIARMMSKKFTSIMKRRWMAVKINSLLSTALSSGVSSPVTKALETGLIGYCFRFDKI